jgi:hypothetical protein
MVRVESVPMDASDCLYQVLSKWRTHHDLILKPRLDPSVRGSVKALSAAGWSSVQIAAELRLAREV